MPLIGICHLSVFKDCKYSHFTQIKRGAKHSPKSSPFAHYFLHCSICACSIILLILLCIAATKHSTQRQHLTLQSYITFCPDKGSSCTKISRAPPSSIFARKLPITKGCCCSCSSNIQTTTNRCDEGR